MMNFLSAVESALLTLIFSLMPATGESKAYMWLLIGLMALAVVAVVVVLILKNRSENKGKHSKNNDKNQ